MVRIIAAIMALGIVAGLGFALENGIEPTGPIHVAASATPGPGS